MTTDATQSVEGELEAEIAGQKVRAKGYRLADLIWLPLCFGVFYVGLTMHNHKAEASEAYKVTANVLRESNLEVAKALRESNAATVEAIRLLTIEQKKSTAAIKEAACLLDPVMRNRPDAREFCKRLTREDR